MTYIKKDRILQAFIAKFLCMNGLLQFHAINKLWSQNGNAKNSNVLETEFTESQASIPRRCTLIQVIIPQSKTVNWILTIRCNISPSIYYRLHRVLDHNIPVNSLPDEAYWMLGEILYLIVSIQLAVLLSFGA